MLHEPGGLDVTTLALRRLRRHQSGTTAVELAVVLPLLVMLLFGIVEFGRAMATYSTAVTASREAARYGSVVGLKGGTPQYEDCDGMRSAAARLAAIAKVAPKNVNITYIPGPEAAVKATCNTNEKFPTPANVVDRGDQVVVTVSVPFKLILPYVPVSPPSELCGNETLENGQFCIRATDRRTIGGRAP
jgi:Flp pilus assembly protein TadG